MRVNILPDASSVALIAADAICEAVRARPDARLGLPTGGTPILAYGELERREQLGDADFSRARVYAIDEFAGVPPVTAGTNAAFYREHLRIRVQSLECPDSAAPAPVTEIGGFADAIRRAGGLDLCVLGIGDNGHIAFNEPGSVRDSRARVVTLEESSRLAHAGPFGGLNRVPTRGMTLGIADLLEARRILVLAQGAHKARIVRAAMDGPQTAAVPASWLQSHSDVIWLLDQAAASLLPRPHKT
ncbi:MAG: glucosamine-6-phosphate deaminase [Chloroflexota bacterium]|nr:glucosamine-6-phosphate deaminase [Chloroflexota bacterium]